MSYSSLLIHTCSRVRRTTIDKWSNFTEATTPGIKCRIEHGNKMVRDFKGEEVLSTALVFFGPNEDVQPADRWDIGDGRLHGTQRIDRQSDSIGYHHLECYLD